VIARNEGNHVGVPVLPLPIPAAPPDHATGVPGLPLPLPVPPPDLAAGVPGLPLPLPAPHSDVAAGVPALPLPLSAHPTIPLPIRYRIAFLLPSQSTPLLAIKCKFKPCVSLFSNPEDLNRHEEEHQIKRIGGSKRKKRD